MFTNTYSNLATAAEGTGSDETAFETILLSESFIRAHTSINHPDNT
jgi:hypothetical protein